MTKTPRNERQDYILYSSLFTANKLELKNILVSFTWRLNGGLSRVHNLLYDFVFFVRRFIAQ